MDFVNLSKALFRVFALLVVTSLSTEAVFANDTDPATVVAAALQFPAHSPYEKENPHNGNQCNLAPGNFAGNRGAYLPGAGDVSNGEPPTVQ